MNIQYAAADKAKTSFGYIGITFLAVLFGSIFLNDFVKVCIYYFNGLREWWRKKKEEGEIEQRRRNQEKRNDETILDMDHVDLEEKLERVYFELVKVNANGGNNEKKIENLKNKFNKRNRKN